MTIFGDAPSVADRGGLPALDACGGHIDPSGYYHWHFGAESIQTNLDEAGAEVTCGIDQDVEALIGFAYDGYAIYGPEEDSGDPVRPRRVLRPRVGHRGVRRDLPLPPHLRLAEPARLPGRSRGGRHAVEPRQPERLAPRRRRPGGGGGPEPPVRVSDG